MVQERGGAEVWLTPLHWSQSPGLANPSPGSQLSFLYNGLAGQTFQELPEHL